MSGQALGRSQLSSCVPILLDGTSRDPESFRNCFLLEALGFKSSNGICIKGLHRLAWGAFDELSLTELLLHYTSTKQVERAGVQDVSPKGRDAACRGSIHDGPSVRGGTPQTFPASWK